MEPRRIKSIIPLRLCIQNLHSYHDFFRKQYKNSHIIVFKHRKSYTGSFSLESKKIHSRLAKLLKKMKFVKGLQLKCCSIWSDSNEPARSIQVAKLVPHIKYLSFSDNLSSQECSFLLEFWLRYLKRLRYLDYTISQYGIYTQNANNQLFTKKIKQLYNKMKIAKINNLKISMFASDASALKSLMLLSDYPPSIKSLLVYPNSFFLYSKINTPDLDVLPRHVTNLRSLDLYFDQIYNITSPFLNSIMKFLYLSSLSLSFLNSASNVSTTDSTEMFSFFSKMQTLDKLRKLELSLEAWTPEIENLLKAIGNCPLSHFSFTIKIDSELQLLCFIPFISQLTDLETLELSIRIVSQFKSKEPLRNLLLGISSLTKLTSIKLCLLSEGQNSHENRFSGVVNGLKAIFTKETTLKTFLFECNQIDPMTDYLELISYVKKQAPCINKLKINIGEYKPQKSEANVITEFLGELKAVRGLHLGFLSITSNQFLKEIIESISSLKYLSILSLGEIKGFVGKTNFIDAVETLLSKRGMRKFKCEISKELRRSLALETNNIYKIDVDLIIKRNPSLEELPQNLPIFAFGRNEDDGWPGFL